MEGALKALAGSEHLPALVYFDRILLDVVRHFQHLTAQVPRRRCLYSLKAATFPFLLRFLRRHGIDGFDASSSTEAELARNVFGPGLDLFVTAPAASAQDLAVLRRVRPRCVHLDSLPSLELFLDGAPELALGVRVNPGIGYSQQALHAAGGRGSRLGLPIEQLGEALLLFRRHGRRQVGLHFHVSCEAPSFDYHAEGLRLLDEQVKRASLAGLTLTHIDVGGGLLPPTWDFQTDTLVPAMSDTSSQGLIAAVTDFMQSHRDALASDFSILFEPGDFIACAAAVMISGAVELRRTGSGADHLILDTNINHFPNVLHYGNTPEVVWPRSVGDAPVVLSGNSCLGGDNIASISIDRSDAPACVVFSARGSYEYTQYNFFNGRFRPSVYECDLGGRLTLVKRDTIDDLSGYWRERVDEFPKPWQSFHFFEGIAQAQRGLHLYHPELRFVSSFELDGHDFPAPDALRQALTDNFAELSNTYGRSLGRDPLRERVAAYESRVQGGRGFYGHDHVAVTLGSTNAIWLVMAALLRRDMRTLLIHCPGYYQYPLGAYRNGIPWRSIHREVLVAPARGSGVVEPGMLLPSLEAIIEAIDRSPDIGALAIAEPALPLGTRMAPGALRTLAEKARMEGWLLLVDETLGDLDFTGVRGTDWTWLRHDHPVIRIKSASKIFGVAGARIGYLCATDAARKAGDPEGDLLHRMADHADSAYSAPPSILGPVLAAGLDILEDCLDDRRSSPGAAKLLGNLERLAQRAARAGHILGTWGIPYVQPHAGASITAVLDKLPHCETDSEPFFRELVHEHFMFVELGGLFNQNPAWPFSLARLGLGRAERDFEKDLQTFCAFYDAYRNTSSAG
ncbi:MAG TPA: aminotransferase class I/II-fold pyridoxal phosphate-dependent enzyme [Kofleriaceae bacterium]|nr:aminotransferase class I/II-fold pyridoxal phosphate-dependent enzyme [Kofleriaceae bacterium]